MRRPASGPSTGPPRCWLGQHPRHQTRRGHPRPHQRSDRAAAGVGGALRATWPPLLRTLEAGTGSGPRSEPARHLHPAADGAGRLSAGRPPDGLPGPDVAYLQKAAGKPSCARAGPAPTRSTRRRWKRLVAACWRQRFMAAPAGAARPDQPLRRAERPERHAGPADRSRRARHLSGGRGLEPESGGPRQPPPGGLRPPGSAAEPPGKAARSVGRCARTTARTATRTAR